jgi:hypothetical protein
MNKEAAARSREKKKCLLGMLMEKVDLLTKENRNLVMRVEALERSHSMQTDLHSFSPPQGDPTPAVVIGEHPHSLFEDSLGMEKRMSMESLERQTDKSAELVRSISLQSETNQFPSMNFSSMMA